MEYQVGENEDIMEELSFDEEASQARSQHLPEFYEFIFDKDYPKRQQQLTRRPSLLHSHSKMEIEQPPPPINNPP